MLVTVIGSAALTVIGAPAPNLLTGRVTLDFGGTGSDLALFFADTGSDVRLLTALNNAIYASLTVQNLEQAGINVQAVHADDLPDAIESLHTTSDGSLQSRFSTLPTSLCDFKQEVIEQACSGADLIVLDSTLTSLTIERALNAAGERPIFLVADAGCPPSAAIPNGFTEVFFTESMADHLAHVDFVFREPEFEDGALLPAQTGAILRPGGDLIRFSNGETQYVRLPRSSSLAVRDCGRKEHPQQLTHFVVSYLYRRYNNHEAISDSLVGALDDAVNSTIIFARRERRRGRVVDAAVARLAHTDQLTGVLNRAGILSQLRSILTAHDNGEIAHVTCILGDIDFFKRINDDFGHNEGDRILSSTVETMRPLLRPSDILGRWGGEEFLCVLPNASSAVTQRVADRIRLSIEQNVFAGNGQATRPVTMSMGVAERRHEETIEVWLHRADEMLYESKHAGRNRVTVANSD